MTVLVIAFIFSFLFYLILTAGSGKVLFWSVEEIGFGLIFSILTAVLVKKLWSSVGIKPDLKVLNPKRWAFFLIYAIGPLFFEMAKANIDVAYRVITGNIKPGIVKISPCLKTDFGTAMLANGITLTPGTLSVDVDKDRNIYVHWIFVESKKPKLEDICSSFPKWIRRIAE